MLALLPACSRTRYRTAADRDAYGMLLAKTGMHPWAPPSDFSLHPTPESRLYDPTPLDDPWLPHPAPQLYGYEIPELPPRVHQPVPESVPAPTTPTPVPDQDGAMAGIPNHLVLEPMLTTLFQRLPPVEHSQPIGQVQPAAFQVIEAPALPPPETAAAKNDPPEPQNRDLDRTQAREAQSGEILLRPIPVDAWQAIPDSCLTRMFEFETLKEEFRRSHEGQEPPRDQLAQGKRLALEDIVYVALLNSREYQTQKELLYRVSLRLSLERYAYQLKFSPFNNGTDVNYNHTRTGGTTVNGLAIPTVFQVEKMLVTGGDLVARFANSVVLTFNGPQGFAADVGSDLVLELNQTVFQRDVRFESLTQAERDVIYAARDFLRFRKSLFAQLASQYYSLIRTYRQVEIDSQNYFTLVRAFHQSASEYRAGLLPRFQLDQVEQNMLAGKSRLIATCNNLESALDNLKLRMGLPTENYVDIDMGELEQLTKRDELSVTRELIRRTRQRLIEERTERSPNRLELLSSSVVLIERMLDAQRLQEELKLPVSVQGDLRLRLIQLRVEAARENTDVLRSELAEAIAAQPPSLPRVFQRTMDLVDALIEMIDRQLALAELRPENASLAMRLRARRDDFSSRDEDLHKALDRMIEEKRLHEFPQIVEQATALQKEAEAVSQELDVANGIPLTRSPPEVELQRTSAQADLLLQQSEATLAAIGVGLAPIAIDMDDAMLTAINLRFDLMNQRGDVADAWRQIKYRGDDLKSILNLNASHTLSTRRDNNSPFDFTFDESDTRVRASLDLPLNRRAQRNNFRGSLIDYQASLRTLMALEDNIKFAVRNDLRGLSLDKEQYQIEVASAALAYERVISVQLELRLGIGEAAPRDFLEAQNAYASALSNVATRHIGYIVDRTQLFLDMELLTVEDDGFWHELYDEEFQPTPYYQLSTYGQPVYGALVPQLWYSKWIRRMECIPPGTAAIHKESTEQQQGEMPPAEMPPAEMPPGEMPLGDAPPAPPNELPPPTP
jgi:outer membrane protein TolC